MPDALLVLADGSVYRGASIGAEGHTDGEVVFSTSMTGYQEMLTDPSFAGQLLVFTYPMIGNYGVDPTVEESNRIQVAGAIVREAAPYASHNLSTGTIDAYLKAKNVIGITGVDTRAITRRIRRHGVTPGTITTNESAGQALERLRALPGYDDINWVSRVTTEQRYDYVSARPFDYIQRVQIAAGSPLVMNGLHGHAPRVALVDGGVKRSILDSLVRRGCAVHVFPVETPAEDLLAWKPDGIVLSPGPGDPRLLDHVVDETRKLIGKAPMLGICLGHQVAAMAMGATTFKLPFGHRGGNHPVQDVTTGSVTITAQNHGYAVDPDGLDSTAYVSHINLNDQTVEGIALRNEPLITIQYHSEACPGPLDNDGIFDRFVELMAAVPGGMK